jgi:hypothetical protein
MNILHYRSTYYQEVRPLPGVQAALAYPWVPPVRAVPRGPAVRGDPPDPCYPSYQEDQGDPQDPAHAQPILLKAIKRCLRDWPRSEYFVRPMVLNEYCRPVLGIRMFLDLPDLDPDPLIRGIDPDPDQNSFPFPINVLRGLKKCLTK